MQTNFITKNKNIRIKSLIDNISSHNQMSTFFSGTDISTLHSEGNDQNCFVSLIVNNAGTYCAAITRKVKERKTVVTKDCISTYEFFGEGEKNANVLAGAPEKTIENTYIEYFMLDVEIEHVNNPLAYLDTRFDEIQEAKRKRVPVTSTTINPPVIKVSEDGNHSPWIPNKYTSVVNPASRAFGNDFDGDCSFSKWRQRKQEEPTLFPEDEMAGMVDSSKWEPDPTIIHRLVCQMVTCSLIVSDNIDLKQWISRWMDKKYKEIFGSNEDAQFLEWKEFIVEFMIAQYTLHDIAIPVAVAEDWDLLASKVAGYMHGELFQYAPDGTNKFIDDYIEVLSRYNYE